MHLAHHKKKLMVQPFLFYDVREVLSLSFSSLLFVIQDGVVTLIVNFYNMSIRSPKATQPWGTTSNLLILKNILTNRGFLGLELFTFLVFQRGLNLSPQY